MWTDYGNIYGYGYGNALFGDIKIVKPTTTISYYIPYMRAESGYSPLMREDSWTFTTTNLTIPSNSYRGGMYTIEYYKYATA